MVPFIDVMLVLLVVFMATAPLITPSQVDLPSIGKAAQQNTAVVQLTLHKDGRLSVTQGGQETVVSLEGLGTAIAAASAAQDHPPVLISADKGVAYENVVQVMDKLQQTGIQRIGLAVVQKPQP